MTGRIIPLHGGDEHQQARLLLPWYVTSQLDEAERTQVEAHLGGCAECRADLTVERRLSEELAGLPVDVEHSWAVLRERIERQKTRRSRIAGVFAGFGEAARGIGRDWRSGAPWLRWTLAGQLGLLLALGAQVLAREPAAVYHALAAGSTAKPGDIVVIFRPETSERALRETLRASDARVVDGPTSTDAYLLYVPSALRAEVLAKLRGAPQIVLAEPVDPGGAP